MFVSGRPSYPPGGWFRKMYVGWSKMRSIRWTSSWSYVRSCKILQQEYQKLEAWIRIRGQRSAIWWFVLMGLDNFSFDRILTGCFFYFSYFYNVEKEICVQKMVYKCMHGFFIFMPPRWIFLWVFTHRENHSYGA
jgi:hypothetical protein